MTSSDSAFATASARVPAPLPVSTVTVIVWPMWTLTVAGADGAEVVSSTTRKSKLSAPPSNGFGT